jgi:prepilin-type N-terminal cleavage/methylation domain-containing protein
MRSDRRESGGCPVLACSLQPALHPRHPFFVISPKQWLPGCGKTAFSLIEMVTVIAILVILMTAGVSLMNGTGSQSRRAATDLLAGMIEQARSSAITSRSYVILAVAEPGDLPSGDESCRLGLFKVETWPDSSAGPVTGVLMSRWRPLDAGVALIGGQVDGLENPLDDGHELTISYGSGKPMTVKVHAIAFNSRGGLHHPAGSSPIVMRIAEGNYRGGEPAPYKRGNPETITENRLKIGRVTARPYRIDG